MTKDAAEDLRQLETHPVLTRPLPGCGPLTHREHAELGEEEARRREAGVPAIKALPEFREAEALIRRLGSAAYVPAVPVLTRLWRDCPVTPVRYAAGHALFAIGTSEAHAELQAAIERSDHLSTFLAVKSHAVTHPGYAFDHLSRYLSDDGLATPGTVNIARGILDFFQQRTAVGVGDESWHSVVPLILRKDERWVRRALELRRHRGVGWSARQLLGVLTHDELDAMLRKYPDPPDRPTRSYSGPRDFVARYRAGDYEDVWRDLRKAGAIEEPSLRDEAMAVAIMTMERVRQNVERVTERLRTAGYPFDDFLPSWSPPSPDVANAIARIESAAGGPCPISLHAFWSVVGEVAWKHAEDVEVEGAPWAGFPIQEADPLYVLSAASTWFSVEEWIERREVNHAEVVGPLEVDLAPDYLHKANISGGAPYSIAVPSKLADPVFDYEEHKLPFVDYLRLCFRWGGFSRIERHPLTEGTKSFIASLSRDLEPF
jgi:hypothetical protein